MFKVIAIKEFTLEKFNELKNIKRANEENNEKGKIYIQDIFECDKKMVDYLLGDNPKKATVIEVIEVIPDKKTIIKKETKTKLTKKK